MSKPKLVAVVATVSPRRSHRDPSNRVVFLFEADQNYSLQAAQRLLDMNAGKIGAPLRVRYELATFKSVRRLLAWAERKRPGNPRALMGWHGPLRLAPAE